MALIGMNVTAPSSSSSFRVGARNVDESGNEFVYVHANGAITGAGYACAIDSAYEATMLSTSNDLANNLVGVPLAAFADNDHGWLQIKGTGSVRVANGALKDVALNTTATPGLLDDDATASAFKITGLYLVATASSGPSNWACVLNYPALAAAAI